MQTRRLGRTDLQLTTIGLGTWAIGGGEWKFGWGPQNSADAIAGIVRGIDLGINWIDTAPVYGDGRSESLVGEAMKEAAPDRPLLATKCSRKVLPDGSVTGQLDAKSVKAECEQSLRRLRIDAIDLYQMHWPEPEDQIEEGWAAMIELQEEGKVRQIGVSNFNIGQLKRLHAMHPIASLQPPYNMLDRRAEDELFAYCATEQIGIVCYSPMGKGLLAGAMTAERVAGLDPTDHRQQDPRFQPPQFDLHLKLVDQLRAVADHHRRSVAELAIAWVLRKSEVTAAIVGVRGRDQIEGTFAAADWLLPEEDIEKIDQLLLHHDEQLHAVCEADIK